MSTRIPMQLSTSTVSKLTGASIRQIDYWARTKLLPPSGQQASGKGSRRHYTFQDLVAVLTVCKLRDRKCPLQQIRTAVRYLRDHYPDEAPSVTLAKLTLITDGKTVYLLTDERQVMDIVTRQWVWSVPLGLLITEASEKVQRLPQEWAETIHVAKRDYHLLITQDAKSNSYTVECRELPGMLLQTRTPTDAARQAATAISLLLNFRERRKTARSALGVAS